MMHNGLSGTVDRRHCERRRSGWVLTAYIQAAMRRAQYELLADGEGFYGHIPELQGVWANAETLEATREELQEVLEDWLMLGLARHDPIPPLDGIELIVRVVA